MLLQRSRLLFAVTQYVLTMKACDAVQFPTKVLRQAFGRYIRIHVGDITSVKVKLRSDES